jgi:hypothetical protein
MKDFYAVILINGLRKYMTKALFIRLTDAIECAKIQKQKHKCPVFVIRFVVELYDE